MKTQAKLKLIQSHKALSDFDYALAVDWAIDLIQQGHETDNVLMLASFSPPYDPLEITPYVTAVLHELALEELDYEKALIAKTHAHLLEILDGQSVKKHLHSLYKLCIQNEFEPNLDCFYYLHHAWEELEEMGFNYYYKGVDLGNIEEVLKQEARKWLDDYGLTY